MGTHTNPTLTPHRPQEYPRVNSREEFEGLINALTVAAGAVVMLPLLILGCLLRCVFVKRGRGKGKGE